MLNLHLFALIHFLIYQLFTFYFQSLLDQQDHSNLHRVLILKQHYQVQSILDFSPQNRIYFYHCFIIHFGNQIIRTNFSSKSQIKGLVVFLYFHLVLGMSCLRNRITMLVPILYFQLFCHLDFRQTYQVINRYFKPKEFHHRFDHYQNCWINQVESSYAKGSSLLIICHSNLDFLDHFRLNLSIDHRLVFILLDFQWIHDKIKILHLQLLDWHHHLVYHMSGIHLFLSMYLTNHLSLTKTMALYL